MQLFRTSLAEHWRQAHGLPAAGRNKQSSSLIQNQNEERPCGNVAAHSLLNYGRPCMTVGAGYCWSAGTNSTRRFWARPTAVRLVATKWVLPNP
jgi:hypothetical protein